MAFDDIRRSFRRLRRRLYRQALNAQIKMTKAALDEDISGVPKDEAKRILAQIKDSDDTERLNNIRSLQASIGQAITVWAKMEMFLVAIFAITLGINIKKAGSILYSIINFNLWLSLITDMMIIDGRFETTSPRWNKTSSKIRGLKDTRDRLAHQPVNFVEDLPSVRAAIFDPRPKSQNQNPLDEEEITQFTEDITVLIGTLQNIFTEIVAIAQPGALPEKCPPPEADPRRSADAQ